MTRVALATVGDLRRVRQLRAAGIAAYQAGRYALAARKFAAAIELEATPELVYHAAQAFRLDGDRARAVEYYERYLELAPRGPAANACRGQLERLRYTP